MKISNIVAALLCVALTGVLLALNCCCAPEAELCTPPSVDWGGINEVEVIEPMEAKTWTEADAIALAQTAWGEARGCRTAEQAAVMWCILNRCDAWGGSPAYQCGRSGQFYGYSAFNPVTDELYRLAVDVLVRWEKEKELAAAGSGLAKLSGRVLPRDYLWFSGDGVQNWFRNAYSGGDTWDWSLPDVYEE